jgi:hypothetical protein
VNAAFRRQKGYMIWVATANGPYYNLFFLFVLPIVMEVDSV